MGRRFCKWYLFNVDGEWIGFTVRRDVYDTDGFYLGFLSDDKRLLRKRTRPTDKLHLEPPPRPERPKIPASMPLAPLLPFLPLALAEARTNKPAVWELIPQTDLNSLRSLLLPIRLWE